MQYGSGHFNWGVRRTYNVNNSTSPSTGHQRRHSVAVVHNGVYVGEEADEISTLLDKKFGAVGKLLRYLSAKGKILYNNTNSKEIYFALRT